MENSLRAIALISVLCLFINKCENAKINTPRVLLPWFENLYVNFTFEIIEGGCYSWSLSRDDIIDLEPLYEDVWGHCSRAARVSVAKSCNPPGSVIILAEEVNTGEILRGDVDIDKIKSLKVMSTTWKLYLEEAPEAFEVVAYDDQGNKFSTLEGVSFEWNIENLGNTVGQDLLVNLIRWRETDYEAPRGVTELESQGAHSHSVLLYGQAMGDSKVTVCIGEICTDFKLQVVASVVLTPAVATIAPGDTLRYRIVSARAGRLTVQNVVDTLYTMQLPDTSMAYLEDTISLVRGTHLGTTSVYLMSGVTEVASGTLTIAEPHAIKVTLRPSSLVIRGEEFLVHCVVFDKDGHALLAGDETLIRLTADGEANVDLLRSTENGTLTDAVAANAGSFTITARLYSIAGRTLTRKVEGQVSAVAIEPLEVVPPELFVAWTDTVQEASLKHQGGGAELVTWSIVETDSHGAISVSPAGVVTVRGTGDTAVQVHLTKYPHVKAFGRVWSAPMEYVQVSSSGNARVGRPHHLHVALTAARPDTGELYNFHKCNCGSFALSLLEGPEPQNVTSATWVAPMEGACCVLECAWATRGVSAVRVSRGRAGDSARIAVRAAPRLLWPGHAAVLVGEELPVLADGEALTAVSSEARVAAVAARAAEPPAKHPDVHLFTLGCQRKGDSKIDIVSVSGGEREAAILETACAAAVARIRLEPVDPKPACDAGPKIWLRPYQEVLVRVTLLDAIGRELLSERGPALTWETSPPHAAIAYASPERLMVETHPEYDPVPVPWKYYQIVTAEEHAIGWSGSIRASTPDATASIAAKVAAPLTVDPIKVYLAWEGETPSRIASITGGSGRYAVESTAGAVGTVEAVGPVVDEDYLLSLSASAPGSYDVVVVDQCIGDRVTVEVIIEEVHSVEVSTSRAICVGSCIPLAALVKGVSHRWVTASRPPEWRTAGDVAVREGRLCGVRQGTGRVRAALAGVWSADVEVTVFPPLQIVPSSARLPPGARLRLAHRGGPPSHLATLHYKAVGGHGHIEVSGSGALHGVSVGAARVRLAAADAAGAEMASAEAEVEVIPISGLRVRAATQTLLVGSPAGVWVEAAGLDAAALAALLPPPKVTFTVRDATAARLYTTHDDDMLERSVAEGLAVRVVPLKPGLITIDVRVRNMGQVAETRSWDSTIEILAVADIRASVDGLPSDLSSGDRLAIAVATTVRLRSLPRCEWKALTDGSFDITPGGEIKTVKPGHGVVIGHHKDERNNVYRETAIHVEVSLPHYCTVHPAGSEGEGALRVALRSVLGRELLAPDANVSLASHLVATTRRPTHSALGPELVVSGLEPAGALLSVRAAAAATTLHDHVWVTGVDASTDRIVVTGAWAVCLEGIGWRGPAALSLYPGSGVTLALAARDVTATTRHQLKRDRSVAASTVHQLPLEKFEFLPGEWPAALVPLSLGAAGATGGPVLCSEDQKYAVEGLEMELPFMCRTKTPHGAEAVLDLHKGQIGCSVIPAIVVTEAFEVELCAEWSTYRTCTKVLLLPPIAVSQSKISLLDPPATFTVSGHPHALKLMKIIPSPGLKTEVLVKDGDAVVVVKGESDVCGLGFVNIVSRLTSQEFRVEVDRECDFAYGTLLGAIFSLIKPYFSTLVTIVAVAAGLLFLQARLQQKSQLGLRADPHQTVLPESPTTPPRNRTWARSPYAAAGPTMPVYGDASVLPDNSFSPNSTRMHSRFL